jgi:hypothetical protein
MFSGKFQETDATSCMLRILILAMLLLISGCSVDDGLGIQGQTEEEFFSVLNPPENLDAKALSGNIVFITWTEVPSVYIVQGFVLLRSEDGENYSIVSVVKPDNYYQTDSGVTLGFFDTNLAPDQTYYYYLRSMAGPFLSVKSITASATTPTVLGPPETPENFLATTVSDTSIKLSWNPAPDASGYCIWIDNLPEDQCYPVDAWKTSETFDHFETDTLYAFKIYAHNENENRIQQRSSPAQAAARTFKDYLRVLDPPENPAAEAMSGNVIFLSWDEETSSVYTVQGFVVHRSEDGANFTAIAVVRPDSYYEVGESIKLGFFDTNLTPDRTYYYYLRSSAGPFLSKESEIVSATTPAVIGPPNSPANFIATAISASSIKLTWNPVADASSYCIWINTLPDDLCYPVEIGQTSEIFPYLNADTEYTFKIYARNLDASGMLQSSLPGNAYAKTDPVPPQPPPVPMWENPGVAIYTATSVKLSWQGEQSDSYEIWRNDQPLVSVDSSVTSYIDGGLTSSTSYIYKIRASNSAGHSDFTTNWSITTPAPPTRPVYLWVTFDATKGNYYFRWEDKSDNESGFKIYVYEKSCAELTTRTPKHLIKTTPPDVISTFISLTSLNSLLPFTPEPGAKYCTQIAAFTPYYTIYSNEKFDATAPISETSK